MGINQCEISHKGLGNLLSRVLEDLKISRQAENFLNSFFDGVRKIVSIDIHCNMLMPSNSDNQLHFRQASTSSFLSAGILRVRGLRVKAP